MGDIGSGAGGDEGIGGEGDGAEYGIAIEGS
jgi:hypothetical protein